MSGANYVTLCVALLPSFDRADAVKMRPTSLPLGVILIASLVATVLTIVLVPHRGAAAPRANIDSIQRL